jgi:hypothetical protein
LSSNCQILSHAWLSHLVSSQPRSPLGKPPGFLQDNQAVLNPLIPLWGTLHSSCQGHYHCLL